MKGKFLVLIWLVPIIVIAGYGVFEKYFSNAGGANVTAVAEAKKSDATNADEHKTSTTSTQPIKNVTKQQPLHSDSQGSAIPIDRIDQSMVGKLVSIVGKVESRKDHEKGHVFLSVSDETGHINVPIFADNEIDNSNLQVGQSFRFSGIVGTYRDSLEIKPRNSDDIEPVYWEDQNVELIGDVDVGKTVNFRCTVQSVYRHPEGHIFTKVRIHGSNQEIEMPIFKSIDYTGTDLTTGSILSIKGIVKKYKGKLQLVPAHSEDIQILKSREADPIQLIAIEYITPKERGKMFQVRGNVANVRSSGGNTFFYLQDEKGHSIKAVLFKAETTEIIGRKAKIENAASEKHPIRVLALVDIYEGELNLIINKVYNVY